MKKIILTAVIFSLLLTVVLLGYTRSWTESTPTDSTFANQIDDYNRYLRSDVAERLETYIGGFNSGDSNEGFYQVLFLEQTSFSTPAANKYVVGGKLVDGKCELVGKDEDGDEIQLSYTGKHMIGSGTAPQAFLYNATEEDTDGGRESTIRAKGEQSGGEASTLGALEFSHHGTGDDQKGRFRILLNSGEQGDSPTIIPISYLSTGSIDVSASVSVLDEDDMASDSATQVATQQSIKKYADDQIAAKLQPSQVVGTSNITNTSGGWADMTDMSITLTTTGGDVLLTFSACIQGSHNNAGWSVRFDEDGTSRHLVKSGNWAYDGQKPHVCSMQYLCTSLSADSHTFKVQWKDDNHDISQNGATYPRVFTAIEIP